MDTASIFDLSPAEKLQLVEDLWDDLAAAPESVPVHGWQKEEMERRKANLEKHPASAQAWEVQRARAVCTLMSSWRQRSSLILRKPMSGMSVAATDLGRIPEFG